MTDPVTPSAKWDAMTDEQRIAWMATEMMEWEKEEWTRMNHYCCETCGKCNESCREEKSFSWRKRPRPEALSMCGVGHYWNPLTDWNYWREIEEKLMEDEELFRKMLHNFVLSFPNEKKDEAGAWQYIYADIPERCKALYLAYQSING